MCEKDHLTEGDFDRLLGNRATREELEAAHLHLFTCRFCLAAFFTHDDACAGLHLDDVYGPGASTALRRELAQPFDTLSATVRAGLEILELPAQVLSFQVMNHHDLDDLALPCSLVERARELWSDAPEDAERILTGVVHALGRRPSDTTLPVFGLLQAHARSYRANVYRILDRFDEAREELTKAEILLRVFDGGPALRGELTWFKGGLHQSTRRFDAAIDHLRKAVDLLPRQGATNSLQARISLANAYADAGHAQENIEALQTLLEDFPPSAFPAGSYLITIQSLATSYTEMGRIAEARGLLPRIQELARKEGKKLTQTRVKWLEARLLKAAGQRTPAAIGFREVQTDFLAANLAMDAALAGLDQAALYLEHGDSRAAAELAEELVPIFRSKGIHREATAAGLIVLEALRHETASLDQVETLAAKLRRLPRARASRYDSR